MVDLVPISDPADEQLAPYFSLRDTVLRRSIEHERGLFIAEGEKIIRRALDAGLQPISFLLAPRWLDSLSTALTDVEAPVYVVDESVAEAATGFHVHRGALAAFQRPETADLSSVLGLNRIIVCEDIVDHTNLGAIIRSAAGLGWDAVVLSPRSADPLYRRAIKTSMGTVFDIPWVRSESWFDTLTTLRNAGFEVASLALDDEALTLDDYVRHVNATDNAKVALVLGTEGHGISSTWLEQSSTIVTIPMAHGVDSLNVAATAAIACYQLRPIEHD